MVLICVSDGTAMLLARWLPALQRRGGARRFSDGAATAP
jgi:hypothetical protein